MSDPDDDLMPRTPQELIDVADLLAWHRAILERGHQPWPSLDDRSPTMTTMIRQALAGVRRRESTRAYLRGAGVEVSPGAEPWAFLRRATWPPSPEDAR